MSSSPRSRLLALAIGTLLFPTMLSQMMGCAHSDPARPTIQDPPRATLEVVNRTPDPARIALEGWELGVVEPGQRHRFRRLRAGDRSLWVLAGSIDRRAPITLRGGAIVPYEILPIDAGVAPLPVPAEFGSLRLVNGSGQDVEVRVDTSPPRTLLAGDTRVLVDQSVGSRTIVASAPGRDYRRTFQVQVTAGQEVLVDVVLETGRVRLTNRTGEPVRVFVDDQLARTVANDTQVDLDPMVIGVHSLRAVSDPSGREYLRTVNVNRDEDISWDLTAAQGRLAVANQTGETVALSVGDAARGELAPGKTIEWDDIPLGLNLITATGSKTGYSWSAEIPMVAGHRARWTLRNDVATARVVNRLDEPVELRVRGESVKTLQPGTATFVDGLRGSNPRLSAFATLSGTILRPEGDFTPAQSLVWEITAPQGQLSVVNDTRENVVVYADGRPLGIVDAQHRVIFTQVPPGERLLEARLGDGAIIRDRVGVGVDATARWNVKQQAGTLQVFNETAEPLAVPPHLAGPDTEIAPGAQVSFTVGTGDRRFHFIGTRTGQSYRKAMTIYPDSEVEWHVQTLVGILHVFNRTRDGQVVRIDGGDAFTVPPGRDAQRTIEAGTHRVVAVSADSGTAREGTVVVFSGSVHPWEIRPSLGYVRIVNTTPEKIVLRVDGAALGTVESGMVRTYGPWPTQTYELVAQGEWSHAIYENRVTLGPGAVEAWEIRPARGAIHATNKRTEAIRLLIDRKEVLEIPVGGAQRVEVPIGPHLVELVGVESLATFRFAPRIRPDQAYTVVAPEGPAMLEVTNRSATTLKVRLGDTELGDAPPDQTVRLPLPRLGDLTFFAESADGITYHRRLDVRGDRVIQWVIRP